MDESALRAASGIQAMPRLSGRTCCIAGLASHLPAQVLSSTELARRLHLEEDWIVDRTGIRERRLADESETTCDLAAEAARRAVEQAGIEPQEVDLIIVATGTPDMVFPATACLVQSKLGAHGTAAFDLKAPGAGFLYALEIGRQFVANHTSDTVLVIGAEKMSAILDWEDRDTCILFGDGAGAAVLRHEPERRGFLNICLGSDGTMVDSLQVPGGGSRVPATVESVKRRLHFLRMEGKGIFKRAVQRMHEAAQQVLDECQVGIDEVRCIVPHQANRRLVEAVVERLGGNCDRVVFNLDRVGNTSTASVPIALAEAVEQGMVERGDLVLLVGFGAGLNWAAALLEW